MHNFRREPVTHPLPSSIALKSIAQRANRTQAGSLCYSLFGFGADPRLDFWSNRYLDLKPLADVVAAASPGLGPVSAPTFSSSRRKNAAVARWATYV